MTTQLDLFQPTITDYPFYRKPNKNEAEIIRTVFNSADYIAYFLDDIIELYHYRQWRRESGTDRILLTIGASQTQETMFYFYEVSTGNIYLLNAFSTFPYKPNEDEEDSL